jgi:addiction module HigA family antidote
MNKEKIRNSHLTSIEDLIDEDFGKFGTPARDRFEKSCHDFILEKLLKAKGVDPNMIANNLESSFLIHPGEMIKDEIESRGITQKQLSEMTGISASVLNEVLNGKRSVTTNYALLFEAALGIDADIWIGLQADYDKQKARRDKSFLKRLEEVRKYAALL